MNEEKEYMNSNIESSELSEEELKDVNGGKGPIGDIKAKVSAGSAGAAAGIKAELKGARVATMEGRRGDVSHQK